MEYWSFKGRDTGILTAIITSRPRVTWTRKNLSTYTLCKILVELLLTRQLILECRNYAKTHPDLCILAVNTFVQDSEDPNPLIRALAIRTMGCIRVDKIVDYMEEPLRKTLRVSRLINYCGVGSNKLLLNRTKVHMSGKQLLFVWRSSSILTHRCVWKMDSCQRSKR